MRIPAHLRRSRHGIYYFRITVPLAVRESFGGRSEIKSSLHTRNLKIAMVEARRLALDAYQSFVRIHALMRSKKSLIDAQPLSGTRKPDRLGKFEALIETPTPFGMQRFHAKADPNSPEDIAAAKAATQDYIAKMEADRQALAQAVADPEAEKIRAEHRAVVEGLFKAATAAIPVPQADAAPAPARRVSQGDRERYLSRLFERFMLHKKKSSLKTTRTENSYRNKFSVFLEWYGDTHILDVTPEDISRYKDYLLGEYVVKAGRTKGKVGLDAPTVDNYLDPLSGLYKWARMNGSFPREMLPPTAEQRMMTKKDKKARAQSGKANRAFRNEELVTAFNPARYREENRLSHHFWPPLIALFTGMRLNEVSQLACNDIFMEEGIWVISINDEDYKKVKSAAARRTIPMHPELITIGLPQFVADVKTLELGPKLFPVLRAGDQAAEKKEENEEETDGELGNAPGKKWDRYLRAVGLTDDALTYHSFRRTANMLLKKKKVPFDVRCQMVGHDMDHVNEFYSSEYTVTDLAEIIFPKFVFEGLDLTALRYQPGEFNQAIKDGHAAALVEGEKRALRKARKENQEAGK